METTVGCECIKNCRHLTSNLPLSSICSFHLSTDQDCGNLSTISCMMMQSDAANQLFCSPLSFLLSPSLAEPFRSCYRPKVYSHLYSCAGSWFLAESRRPPRLPPVPSVAAAPSWTKHCPGGLHQQVHQCCVGSVQCRALTTLFYHVDKCAGRTKVGFLHGDDACGNSVAAD